MAKVICIMNIFSRVQNLYKNKIYLLVQYCKGLDSKKTAFAIAVTLCIGTVPLIGFTFIFTLIFGFVFRLNHFIVQSVHFLVTPLQFVLFYPFIRAGQYVFQYKSSIPVTVHITPAYIYNHFDIFVEQYLKVLLAATSVWFMLSMVAGYFSYRVLQKYFSRLIGLKTK